MAVLHWSIAEPEKLAVATGGTVDRGHVRRRWRGHICQNCSGVWWRKWAFKLPMPHSVCLLLHWSMLFFQKLLHGTPLVIITILHTLFILWQMLSSSNCRTKNVNCEWMEVERRQWKIRYLFFCCMLPDAFFNSIKSKSEHKLELNFECVELPFNKHLLF